MASERVLVLLYGDGFVAVHADRNAAVKIVRVPHLPAHGIKGELTAEEYVADTIGHRFADLLALGYQKASENMRPLTIRGIRRREGGPAND